MISFGSPLFFTVPRYSAKILLGNYYVTLICLAGSLHFSNCFFSIARPFCFFIRLIKSSVKLDDYCYYYYFLV